MHSASKRTAHPRLLTTTEWRSLLVAMVARGACATRAWQVVLHRIYAPVHAPANHSGGREERASHGSGRLERGGAEPAALGPRLFRNPHSLHGVRWTALRTLDHYAHFTLTEEALNGTRRKIRAHQAEAKQRLASNLSVQEFIKGELNSTTIVCSLGYDTRDGVCRDYTMLLYFMQAQTRNPMRNLAPFCYRAPERPDEGVRRCEQVGEVVACQT